MGSLEKKLSEKGFIHETVKMTSSKIGRWCEIGAFTMLQNTTLGDYSYTGSNCIFQNTNIGKFSNIAAYVRVGATDHPLERPTLHHFTYRSKMYGLDNKDDEDFFAKRKARIATIGHDTWIGHGVLTKPEIEIGNGAVIGQGSVVTKNIPPYAIAVGVPAKVIRFRFAESMIEALERIKWWDWPHEKIKENLYDFRGDISSFIIKHDRKEGLNETITKD
ncbi:MAG: chloramphenicol acetyltransferase [Clostridiales bacterium]|nr:chloramphenicol acetyltransferase [Clostridiales bacterium]